MKIKYKFSTTIVRRSGDNDDEDDDDDNNNNNNNNNKLAVQGWKIEAKDFEKTTRLAMATQLLRLELTNRYPEYKVNQYSIIVDVLGGCSKEVEQNMKELVE